MSTCNELILNNELDLQAVKLTSVRTQLPYEYYHAPFCEPDGGIQYKSENLGKLQSPLDQKLKGPVLALITISAPS